MAFPFGGGVFAERTVPALAAGSKVAIEQKMVEIAHTAR
jgi:hypothetical protein